MAETHGIRRAVQMPLRAVVAGITLLAFGLRLFRLDTQSIWGDEAISVFRALESLADITAKVPAEGTLPPLYYYLLHFWIPLVGQTEFAVRYLSVLPGVIAVPLLYAAVRWSLGPAESVVAALLAACSPFWVYYSQETRTYALVTSLLIGALYVLVRAGDDRTFALRWRSWIIYGVVAALALTANYFAGFALAAVAVWLLWVRRREAPILWRCLLGQLGALVLVSPLLIFVAPSLLATAGSVERGANSPIAIGTQLAQVFNFGSSLNPTTIWPLITVALSLGFIGLLSAPRRAAVWALAFALPVVGIYVVSFVPHVGWARYFIHASPGWYVLMSAGVVAVGTGLGSATSKPARFAAAGLGTVACALVLFGMVWSLRNYYFDPQFWRYDLRSSVQAVESPATSDAAVVVNGPTRFPSYFYYYKGSIPAVELPRPDSEPAESESKLTELLLSYRSLWLVKYQPPDYDPNLVERWLSTNSYKASVKWVENVAFTHYISEDPAARATVYQMSVPFGDTAQLIGYRSSVVRAQGKQYLLVTLAWRALATPKDDISVFAHLLDSNGRRLAQSDHRPGADTRPSWTWRPGDVIEDRFALEMADGDAGRPLRLAVGLFKPDGSRIAPASGGSADGSIALPLPIQGPVSQLTPMPRQVGTGVQLLGYRVPAGPVKPGEAVTVSLGWQRNGAIGADYTVFVHLLSADERVVAQQDSQPARGQRPTSTWLPGETLLDEYDLTLPPNLPPGEYRVELGMYLPATGQRLPIGDSSTPGATADRVLLPQPLVIP